MARGSLAITFYTSSYHIYQNGEVINIKIPEDADMVNIFEEQVIIDLKSDWEVNGKVFRQGSLVSAEYLVDLL